MKTDAELLGAFSERRDQAAFETLVRRHERLVVSVCRRVLEDGHEALDAAQAAFLALAMKADRLDRTRPLAPWLHRVAYATAVSARRSRDARRAREREVCAMAGRPGSDVGELRAWLDREIDALPDRYRRPVVMVHLEGKSLEETAAALGTTSGTVGSWLSRGRERLRDGLERRGVAVAPAMLLAVLASTADAASGGFAAWTARAAAGLSEGAGTGGCATGHVVGLAKGALQMMIWTKVKTASLAAAAALCATAGIGASAVGAGPSKAVAVPAPMVETAALPEVVPAVVETLTDATAQEPPKASADLVGHWTFDEAEGEKVEDASGQGHAGTIQGAATRGEGKLGKALVFDGRGGHVEIFKTTVLDAVHQNSYTVAAWFKPENLPPGTEDANDATYGIVLRSGWHLGLAYNNEGKFIMTHWTAPETWAGAGSWEDTYSPGQWYHVAGVVDRPAGTVKIYVNGEEKGTGDFAAGAEPKAYETSWKIGIGGPGAEKWAWPAKGAIDDVRLYRKALSADDILTLFKRN